MIKIENDAAHSHQNQDENESKPDFSESQYRIPDTFKDGKITMSDAVRKRYEKIYGLVGNHSAIEICSWTKKAIRNKGVCYKQVFYGVKTHMCAQMSPAAAWCQLNCTYCWRPMEWMYATEMKYNEVDDPDEIIQETVRVRKRLISGIGGAEDVNEKLFKESFEGFPVHWAISLSGEPTIYPRLDEMVKLLRDKYKVESIFIVTNGQRPDMLKRLNNRDALPTQLYLSLTSPNKSLFENVNRPTKNAGSWEKLMESLNLIKHLNTRRVIRITLIKGVNDSDQNIEQFAKLLDNCGADFIEVKAYMWIGLSRQRLKLENMPLHSYIQEWSKKLESKLGNYNIVDEHPPSRIVLFMNKHSKYKQKIFDR